MKLMTYTHSLILVGAVSIGTYLAVGQSASPNRSLSAQIKQNHSAPDRSGPLGGYAEIVEDVSPSVVSVFTSKNATVSQSMGGPFDDPMFRRFFGTPDNRYPGPSELPKQDGQGSGVIITDTGYIITNNHVVDGADEIKVALEENGRTYDAKVIGQDPKTDLAVVKIDASDLPAATVGDSSMLKVGDTVLAIGNPFGLSKTVTTGIVSALGRSNVGIVGYENFIQTDASINPGNSGGALVDNRGSVVGINTAILSRSGGNVGIGFSIPINMAINIADQLITDGEIQRGFLGVMLGELTPKLAEALNVDSQRGVLLNEVFPDTPAADAGLENGDVLVAVDGKAVESVSRVRLQVSSVRPGLELPVTVLRDGREKLVTVTIGRLPDDRMASNSRRLPGILGGQSAASEDLLEGVTVRNLTAALRQQLPVEGDVEGIVVMEVAPNSAAAASGLKSGDLITEVARQQVSSVQDALEARKEVAGDVLLLRVWREGSGRFVAVDVS